MLPISYITINKIFDLVANIVIRDLITVLCVCVYVKERDREWEKIDWLIDWLDIARHEGISSQAHD